MRSTRLDFASKSRTGPAGWALLFVGASALSAIVAWTELHERPRLAALETKLAVLQKALQARRPPAPKLDGRQAAEEWAAAKLVAGELNRPWEPMFAALEIGTGRPVALLSVEPDAAKRQVVLTGEAKDFGELLAYCRFLEGPFHSVVLQTHSIDVRDGERPVRFRIAAGWGFAS